MDRQATVLDVIATVSGKPHAALVPEAELVAHLGIDSAKALAMLLELEDRLGIEIDDERVGRPATVGDVLQAVSEVDA